MFSVYPSPARRARWGSLGMAPSPDCLCQCAYRLKRSLQSIDGNTKAPNLNFLPWTAERAESRGLTQWGSKISPSPAILAHVSPFPRFFQEVIQVICTSGDIGMSGGLVCHMPQLKALRVAPSPPKNKFGQSIHERNACPCRLAGPLSSSLFAISVRVHNMHNAPHNNSVMSAAVFGPCSLTVTTNSCFAFPPGLLSNPKSGIRVREQGFNGPWHTAHSLDNGISPCAYSIQFVRSTITMGHYRPSLRILHLCAVCKWRHWSNTPQARLYIGAFQGGGPMGDDIPLGGSARTNSCAKCRFWKLSVKFTRLHENFVK